MAKVNTEEVKSTVKKAAAATKRAAKKAATPKSVVMLQYEGKEIDTAAVVAEAKSLFKAEMGRVAVKTCDVYLKPQEDCAYFVINETFSGKIDL